MATETGTASDYKDLLQKLKIFLTGGSASPLNGLDYVVEEERSGSTSPLSDIPDGDPDNLVESSANNDQDHDQIIFSGSGGTSPENRFYFAIQTYGLSTTGFFNWQIRGLTGYSTSSPQYVALRDQPGRSPPCWLPLQNTTMTYWFIANNRRLMGAIKTGTSYQTFYIGFLNTFALETEYPYPMVVLGTSYNESRIFNSNTLAYAGLPQPGSLDAGEILAVQGDVFPDRTAPGWVRFSDGNWYAIKNFSAGGTEANITGASGSGVVHVWPLSVPSNVPAADGNVLDGAFSFGSTFRSITPGGTPTRQILQSFGSPQLSTMWPLTLYNPNTLNIYGDLDGCYWIPGAGGLTSEDTITDFGESPEVEHIVFQNVHRTDAWMYVAMRNE